jgi:hypothetical protein
MIFHNKSTLVSIYASCSVPFIQLAEQTKSIYASSSNMIQKPLEFKYVKPDEALYRM